MSYIHKKLQQKRKRKKSKNSEQKNEKEQKDDRNVDLVLNEMLGKREVREKKIETYSRMKCSSCKTMDSFGEAFRVKGRRFASFSWIENDKICVFGGESDLFAGNVRNDLHTYNINTKIWVLESSFPGKGRTKHSMICRDMLNIEEWQKHFDFPVLGKELVVYGGEKAFTESTNEVLAYNFDLRKWRVVPCRGSSQSERSSSPAPVHSHTALYVKHKNAMVVFGGENPGSLTNNHVFFLEFNSNDQFEWKVTKSKNDPPIMGRSQHTALLYNNDKSMIVFGGFSNNPKKKTCYLNDTWMYDIERNSWDMIEVTGDIPSPRFGHSATLWKHYMYIFGGGVPFMPGLFRLNLQNNVWEEITIINKPPSPRYGHIMFSRPKKRPFIEKII